MLLISGLLFFYIAYIVRVTCKNSLPQSMRIEKETITTNRVFSAFATMSKIVLLRKLTFFRKKSNKYEFFFLSEKSQYGTIILSCMEGR